MITTLSKIKLLLVAALWLSASSAALARDPEITNIWISQIDSPSRESVALQPVQPPRAQPDPSWTVRTGAKKGVLDRALDAELFAGPDAAVLKSGFFEPWQSLLAEFREPSVLVDPGRIAGLEKTKPYLIIPSGALRGFSGSEFFKAGLAEYVQSGGVIICFSQQNGLDFTALPVPPGGAIAAAGWQQDTGPIFRASSVQTQHPMLAGTRKTTPDIETTGYLTAFPLESKIILSRIDGFPTLIVYPCGSGWVVIATLFSDFSYEYGHLETDEKILVRDILSWAKSPARTFQASVGEKLNFALSIQGPEQGEASSVKLMVMGPKGDEPKSEESVKASVKANQVAPLTFSYTVPSDMQPGPYHIEYLLFDSNNRPMGGRRESDAGRFSIGQPKAAALTQRLQQPISGFPGRIPVRPAVERSGNSVRLTLGILPESKTLLSMKQTFFVRASGREKMFTAGTETASLSIDIPEQETGKTISFVLYHSNGRSLARGTVPVAGPAGTEVSLDKRLYLPGQEVLAILSMPGGGEFALTAPGTAGTQLVTNKGSLKFKLPAGLPEGTYHLPWTFNPLEGKEAHGEVSIDIAGYRVRIQDAVLENKIDRGIYTSTARLRIHATQKLSARILLSLCGPDGKVIPVADTAVTLLEGIQDIPLMFTANPEATGLGELRYSVLVRLPEGPGFGREPLTLASGRILFDIGGAAVLGVATARPVYYEPTDPVDFFVYLFGKGRARLELSLDNKKIRKEKLDLAGPYTFTMSVPTMGPGVQTVTASIISEKLESAAAHAFVYGARLPDLAVSMDAGGTAGVVLPVGIGIRNRGKSASAPSKAALYEGDPAKGGTLISRVDVPPLVPDELHVAIVDWPLFGKSGNRMLTAVANADSVVAELDKSNNRVSTELTIPDLLLTMVPQKTSFTAEEHIVFDLIAANLSADAYKDLRLSIDLIDAAGRTVPAETMLFPEFSAGTEKQINRRLKPAPLPAGAYVLRAQLAKNEPLAVASSVITILPTLLLSGALDSTPSAATLCSPLVIQYSVSNTGNIPVSAGSLKIEIKGAATGQMTFARQLPLTLETTTIRIEKVEFPRGAYTLALKASAMNQQQGVTREFALAEQALTVSAPILVNKGGHTIPRILIWVGRTGTAVQQALAEKIVKQAFEGDDIYYTIVDKAEDFTNQAMSGIFNAVVLFETDALLEQFDWLRDRIERGQGMVIIGSDERTRMAAETFGFTFSEALPGAGSTILFTEDSGMELSGTMPISGRILLPQKKNAKTAALFTGEHKPAVLIDKEGNGRVIVLPFSLTYSALNTGTTSLYSLLLRAAIRNVAPESEKPSGIASVDLEISAPEGPARTRVVETLPPGARVVWMNAGGTVKNNTIVYDLIADKDPQKLHCLYQPPAGTKTPAITEVFYECNGKLVSQGKIE